MPGASNRLARVSRLALLLAAATGALLSAFAMLSFFGLLGPDILTALKALFTFSPLDLLDLIFRNATRLTPDLRRSLLG